MEGDPPPVEDRRRLQEELSEFVESCCRTLEEVTVSLGWNLDRLDPGEEEAAEVRGAGARGTFGGPQPAVFCGGRRISAWGRVRGSPQPAVEPWWAPRTGLGAPLTPLDSGLGRASAPEHSAPITCAANPRDLGFQENVKMGG